MQNDNMQVDDQNGDDNVGGDSALDFITCHTNLALHGLSSASRFIHFQS